MRIWYKIVDIDEDGNIKTLYHGVNKSRILRIGQWLEAEKKMVRDGSCQTRYESAFHVLPSYEECIKYLRKFKRLDQKRIVTCKAKKVRAKKHSKADVFLAEKILIEDNICEPKF
jgi:hypothetical protein